MNNFLIRGIGERHRLGGRTSLIILVLTLFLCGGCWDRRELGTLGIVAGFGIDLAEEDNKILFTAQIIKPSQVKAPQGSSGGGAGGGEEAVWVAHSKADSVFKGIRNFLFESSRKLYYPHNQILVIGKKAAAQGIGPLIDIFLRDQEPRSTEWLLIAEDKASEVLKAKSELEKIPAIAIGRLMENYDFTSEIIPVNLHQFISELLSETSASYAPLIKAEGEGKEKRYRISGTAVFRKDKYVGDLTTKETRGLLWVLGRVRGGIITIDYNKEKIDIEIVKSSCKISPEIIDGQVRMSIEIKEEGNLGANLTPINLSTSGQLRDSNAKQALEIEAEIRAAIDKAQALKTDVFGFGEALYRKYPNKWSELSKKWPDLFSSLEVKVVVDSNLRLIGTTTRPVTHEMKK